MSFAALVAATILSFAPYVPEARADRLGLAIHAAVGEDEDAAAALLATGHRESGWRADVGACEVAGEGGALGIWQLDPTIWGRSCGTP